MHPTEHPTEHPTKHLTDPAAVRAALADPQLRPPPPAPGAVFWLRSRVSRFDHGPSHLRRRALAAEIARVDPQNAARLAADRIAAGDSVRQAVIKAFSLVRDEAVNLIIDVAASYFDPTRPCSSLEPLLDILRRDETHAETPAKTPAETHDETLAARIGVLVQACEATATLAENGLVHRPRTTKRVTPDGTELTLDLAEFPFGAPPRECPGRHLALTIAEAIAHARLPIATGTAPTTTAPTAAEAIAVAACRTDEGAAREAVDGRRAEGRGVDGRSAAAGSVGRASRG